MAFINLAKIDFGGSSAKAKLQEKSVSYTENGEYVVTPDEKIDGLSKVSVAVDVHPADKLTASYTENGVYSSTGEYKDAEITVDVHPTDKLTASYTENGVYTSTGEYKDAEITVNIDTQSYYDQGVAEQKAKLTDISITENGTYNREDGYKSVVVNVPQEGIDITQYMYLKPQADTTGLKKLGWEDNDIYLYKYNHLVRPEKITDGSLVMSAEEIEMDKTACTDADNYKKYYKEITFIPKNPAYLYPQSFVGCHKLKAIPEGLDVSGMTNGVQFSNCYSLVTLPYINTKKWRNSSYKEPDGTTGGNSSGGWYGSNKGTFFMCSSLEYIDPRNDFTELTDAKYMFKGCFNLRTFEFNMPLVTNTSSMFRYCSALQSFSGDFSASTDTNYMFSNCSALQSFSGDFSLSTNTSYMFYNCYALQSFSGDFSASTNTREMFSSCSALQDVTLSGSINASVSFTSSSKLTYDSVKSILTAASNTTNTNSKTLSFEITMTDKDSELANLVSTCTEKGWTVSGLTIK